ncbi:acyl-CoA N-acyltransferase [Neocallimastix lanati (nom. inval.)]|uniref:Acyl-CoA N-acyltransferase n=1 Tax=Neocallimastix californiae TaxID=1754190 RepID=A0A1Y2ANF0_9FUNG|nr:acyl-CoA N-acyltransferase [Neocallimastix sp. JGI-2020a]ORY24042.1 acyl-CoA N-acyltransferase [Neocallimastix californiae]|eukprot:ORY24042.1 acyl-CoA N-acyltransferase [Neocallimastix californiae]
MDFIIKTFDELTTRELYEILKTRQEIFVVEQNCPYMDLDDLDDPALHVFCWNEKGRVAAYLRVFERDKENGVVQIGRVVTLVHGQGLGGKILHTGVEVAIQQLHAKKIYLEAQTYAIGYYEREGFKVVSEPFLEDNIPHVKMERIINNN